MPSLKPTQPESGERPGAAPVIAEVVVGAPLRRSFDYTVPDGLRGRLQPGMRVVVPFGRRPRGGIVVALKESSDLPPERLRDIEQVPGDAVLFSEAMLDFTHWVADYYFCGWGEVLEAAIPTGLGARFRTEYALREPSEGGAADGVAALSPGVQALLSRGEPWDEADWHKAQPGEADWRWLRQATRSGGRVATHVVYAGTRARPAMRRWVRLGSVPPPLPRRRRNPLSESRQDKILRILRTEGEAPVSRLRTEMSDPSPVLKQLAEAGAVELFERQEERRAHTGLQPAPVPFIDLNPPQRAAFEQIAGALKAPEYRAFLLDGVTGSGKTEVYLHAVRAALAQGRGALVLVPEIALTAAIVERFRSRFGQQVAVLHSRLAEGERFDEWSRVHRGEATIVIGARSAVFAPLHNLGLVIVDEEHDGSYKQEESPRYQGRDAALMRAYKAGAVAVLGSATPALESVRNVALGKLTRLVLGERVSARPMPEVALVGLRATPRQPGSIMFSKQLVEALRATLLRKEQAILFLNRRGFAQLARCKGCVAPVLCDNCTLAMTYHRVAGQLRCHRCEFQRALPEHCPDCGAPEIELVGLGTERIEQEVGIVFPEARVLRMDSDTLRARGELERMLQAIRERDYDIIIGTQILSKGHDFPHITLVGAVLADLSLNLPDFRAAERTFQLLTQMAGRAGRGDQPGTVMIQTYNPAHYSLVHVMDHDAAAFARDELAMREETGAPPFSCQALVWTSSGEAQRAQGLAQLVATHLRAAAGAPVTVLGPVEAPIRRLNNRYRWMVLLRAPTMAPIHRVLTRVLDGPAIVPQGKDRLIVDVDPYNLL